VVTRGDKAPLEGVPRAAPETSAPAGPALEAARAAAPSPVALWRLAVAWLGLAVFAVVAAALVEGWSGIAYLSGLYGSLGRGPLPALLALSVLVASLTLAPALAMGWPLLRRAGLRRVGIAALGMLVLAGGVALVSRGLGRATPSVGSAERLAEADLTRTLSELGELARRLPKGRAPTPPLATSAPVVCAAPPDTAVFTLVAGFIERERQAPVLECFQGPELRAVVLQLGAALSARALRGPLELELLSGFQAVSARHVWLDAFKWRPGLDGVCNGGSCVMPWQLLAAGAFSTFRPLGFIPDLQFGVDVAELRRLVGAEPGAGAGLTRIATRSFVLDLAAAKPRLVPLARMRRREVPLRARALERAERDAEAYVLGAQLPDGRFRYTLDPMTGQADTTGFNLARQAGTTLVLCELGQPKRVRAAIERGLAAFSPFVRTHGQLVALTGDPSAPVARLGESALPLVSMLACAPRTRGRLAAPAPGLARLLLRLQRPDGSFAPGLDLGSGEPIEGPEPLYAPGQAVMALVLLEERLSAGPSVDLPPLADVRAAVERAMQYFSERYWRHPLRDFFFLEENWHCLAARAALAVHRHAGYEQLCIDYVRFKSRLILDARDGVDADFDGGFGFGTLVPPHNTGAAGFGEALAAALPILRERGATTAPEQELLGRVMRFLLRQQWSQANCFACATPAVIGGMSEHTHSAVTRIDFAQHAWAALGHGRRALGPPL
jgi:hypothetical protein